MLKKIFLILFMVFALCKISFANKQSSEAIIDADKVFYNKKLNKLVAEGSVEVYKEGFFISANKLEYDKTKKELQAIGNVKITEPNGTIFYGTSAKITNNLKIFIVNELLSKIDSKITFGAKQATYSANDKELNMKKASITSCKICKGKTPQWQFNSGNIKYDENNEVIYHKNSFFEVYGVPVFYTPFFSHLSPNAKVKSGFLNPSYQYNNFYGNALNINYYYRINNSSDLTFSPVVTSKQGVLYQMNFRKLFQSSSLDADIAYNEARNAKISNSRETVKVPTKRYLYNVKFSHDFNNRMSFRTKINRVSDKSFLRNYYNKNENFLTSEIEARYRNDDTYGTIKTIHFQGLRKQDNSELTPEILPILDVKHQSYFKNNILNLDGNLMNLKRSKGVGLSRSIVGASLERTSYIMNNLEWQNMISFRADRYDYKNIQYFSPANYKDIDFKKTYNRTIPLYQTNLSYPLLSRSDKYVTILQPILQFIASPSLSDKKHVLNEDSLNIEISDSNLFSNNRYSGYDMFESGARANYGVVGITRGNNKEIFYMIGQAYRFKKKDKFISESGWKNKKSDIVGHIGFSWNKNSSLFYKYRVEPNIKRINRNEIELKTNLSKLEMSARYIRYNKRTIEDETSVIESLGLSPRLKINNRWSMEANIERNASKKKSFMVSSGVALLYDGDCLWSKISASKDYTKDYQKNIKPSVTISFDFILKGLQ